MLSALHTNFCQFNSANRQNFRKEWEKLCGNEGGLPFISPVVKVYLTVISLQFQSERKEQFLKFFQFPKSNAQGRKGFLSRVVINMVVSPESSNV